MLKTLILLTILLAPLAGQEEPQLEKIALRVAYVGELDAPRGKSFVAFLERNFVKVEATSARAITSPDAAQKTFAEADVLVVDANLAGKLPPAYGKPMLLLSGPGVQTAESLGAKLDWL